MGIHMITPNYELVIKPKLVLPQTLRPNAAGDLTQLTVVGAATNWEAVDEETSDDDTTYVHAVSPTWVYIDLYNLGDLPTVASISKVTVYAVVRNPAPPQYPVTADIRLKTYNTNYSSGVTYLPQNWIIISQEYATNPFTGLAWTKSEVDALQAGVGLTYNSSSGAGARCTQVYVVVS